MEAPRPLSRPRRHRGARHLARGLRLGALTAALVASAVAPTSAAAAPGVEVFGPTGLLGHIEPGELQYKEDGANGTISKDCPLRARPGEAPTQTHCNGLPIATALERVGAGSFGFLTVPRPDGTTVYLSAGEIEEPEKVFEGEAPPIFGTDSESTRFYRPVLAGDPDDVNAADNSATSAGQALVVTVHQGKIVQVEVTPSAASTSAGAPVELQASAEGEVGESFEFSWSFGDGTSTTSREPVTHAFAGRGTYEVRVTATGSDGSGGESGTVPIVVGDPPTTPTPGATSAPAAEPPTTRPNGPQGKGRSGRGGRSTKPGGSGGRKGADGGKPVGSGDGSPATHADGRNRARRSSPRKHTSPDGPPQSPPTVPPAGAASEASRSASSEAGLGGTSPADIGMSGASPAEARGAGTSADAPGGSQPSEAPSDRPKPDPSSASPTNEEPDQNSASTTDGELVEGRLVGEELGASANAVEEALGGSAPGSGAPSAAGQVPDDGGGIAVPIGALAVAGLLAAGALFEWRRSRPIR